MGEFFNGRRRKVGLLTLMLACAFMAGWVRSKLLGDRITVRYAPFLHYVYSNDGSLHWDRYTDAPVDPSSPIGQVFNVPSEWTIDQPDTWILDSVWQNTGMNWQIEWCGLRIGTGRKLAGSDAASNPIYNNVGSFIIDYWLVVIPLTLVSAYLLFSKPRKTIRNKTAEPIAAEVV